MTIESNAFRAPWGFYWINHVPQSTDMEVDKDSATIINCVNIGAAIPIIGCIAGLAMVIFSAYQLWQEGYNDHFYTSALVKGLLTTIGAGPILFFVDLGLFFYRLHLANQPTDEPLIDL